MSIDSKQQTLLTFRVGPVLCCAPSLPVRSIITPPKLTRIAGSDPSQPGIFKHDSHIVKVLDLRQKFGIEESEQIQPGNLIVTIFEKESFAFWVDKILDVIDFPSEGWGNLPAAIPRGVFSRTLLLNQKIHLYSEFEKLATIHNLGYLKQYIQQLTLQEKKSTTSETTKINKEKPVINSTSKINPDDKKDRPLAAANPFQSVTEKQDKVSSPALTQHAGIKNTTIKFSTQTEKKITQKQTVKRSLNIKETIKHTSTVTNHRTQQQTSSKITPDKVVKHQFNTHTDIDIEHVKPQEKNYSSQTSYTDKYQNDDNETSYIGVFIFFILILGSLAAGLYYLLYDDFTSSNKYNKETKIENTELNYHAAEIKPAIKKSTPELIQDKSFFSSTLEIKEEPQVRLNNSENKPAEHMQYRADITQLDDEITIIIHQPATKEISQQAITAKIPQQIEDEIKDEVILSTPPVKTLKKDELSKLIPTEKIINEVMHTVVKGDTLWAIAKKYVNDPFLYPELARLSNIKNPHRIYPGNRVRIRFIKN